MSDRWKVYCLCKNSHFCGMGYLSSDIAVNELHELKEHVLCYSSNEYIMQLIYNYSDKFPSKVKKLFR